MRLINSFDNKLAAFHREELLKLLEQALTAGEFGGGRLFDRDAVAAINKQSQDFDALPRLAAGSRAIAENVNHPYELLQARLQAIGLEVDAFETRIGEFIELLKKDSSMVDKLLAVSAGDRWAESLPSFNTGQKFHWDFGAGHGLVAASISPTDPTTNVIWPRSTEPVTFQMAPSLGGQLVGGLAAPADIREVAVKSLSWSYPSAWKSEELYGPDWAQLSLLQTRPVINFGPPVVTVDLPVGGTINGVFEISGTVEGGSLPIYVRVFFLPRRVQKDYTSITGAVLLSPYRVPPAEVAVFDSQQTYTDGVHYSVDDDGQLTVLGPLDGEDVSVMFTEFFPAYECSVNGQLWSSPTMLDPLRPYPDTEKSYHPVEMQGDAFPVTDELGVPMGFFLKPLATVPGEMLFRITTPAGTNYGSTATLEVELERSAFLNAFRLSPFSNFPVRIRRVEAEGFTSDSRTTLFDSSFLLDRTVVLRFPRQIVRKLYVTFYQESYAVKEHVMDPPDHVRRESINRLQSVLPFSSRRTASSSVTRLKGAQYEFAVEGLVGQDWQAVRPGVFVTGPYRVAGMPELIRLDADILNDVDAYILFRAYDANGQLIDLNELVATYGQAVVYSSSEQASNVDFFVKFILRDELSVLKRFQLQVTTES